MNTRYIIPKPLSKARMRDFVGLDNLTAQTPLIEIIHTLRDKHVRIWTAYDYDRVCGTYTAVYPTGMVMTVTVYPGGRHVTKTNRPADKYK